MKERIKKAWELLKPRLKSPVVWTGLAAAIVAIFGDDVCIALFGRDGASINATIDTVCGLLVAFGLLNNPENREGF